MKKILVFLATGCGLGLSPFAPGTVGSLPGPILAWLININLGVTGQIITAAIFTGLSVLLCEVAERTLGKKDDRRIVADEYLTFPIGLIGLPVIGQPGGWIMMPVAFITARIFDIIKPPPAYKLQAVHGGFGITVDDFIASFYALAVNHGIFHLARHFGLIG